MSWLTSRRHALLGLAVIPWAVARTSVRGTQAQDRQQGDVVDAATFSLWTHEQRIGREQWSLTRVRATDGVAFELRAESTMGERRTAWRVEADSAGTPVRLTLEERTGARLTRRIGGQRMRGRFTTLARSGATETSREVLLVPNAILLEGNGVGQFALALVHRSATGTISGDLDLPVLSLQATRPSSAHLVVDHPADTVTVAGTVLTAMRWRLTAVGEPTRLLWLDARGRLVRIQIPDQGVEARRDDLPRKGP